MTVLTEARDTLGRELRQISITRPTTWAFPLALMAAALLSMRQSFTVRATHGLTPLQFTIMAGVGIIAVLVALGICQLSTPPAGPTAAIVTGFVIILATYAAAATRGMTADECVGADRVLLIQVMLVGAFLLVTTIVRTPRAVVLILRGLVAGATVSAMFALVQTATGQDLAPMFRIPVLLKADVTVLVTDLFRAGVVRPQGSAGHPLELSAVLTAVVPLGLAVTLYSRKRGERWWLWAGATSIITLAALSTVSRSAVVGIIVVAAILAVFSPIKRTMIGVGAVLAGVLIALAFNVPILNRLAAVISGGSQDGSLESRGFGVNYVATHLSDHLWFGQGPGTYDLMRQPVLDNEYLTRLIEGGLLGLLAFCLILGTGLVAGLTATIRAARARHRLATDLAACVTASLAVIAITATVLDVSGFAQISSLMMLLIPLAVVLTREDADVEQL